MQPRGRAMSRSTRLWPSDEELAKKDDDINLYRPNRQSSWQAAARIPRRRLVARLAIYSFLLFMLVLAIVHVFGSPNHGSMSHANRYSSDGELPKFNAPWPPNNRPSAGGRGVGGGVVGDVYTGPVKLPQLGDTLRAIGGTNGGQPKNRNVLFAAASLESASSLLPMACQMAMQRRNYVHFAFMGRSDISMEDLLKLNGIDATCQLILHDARPDHAAASTDRRMSLSVARAMHHVNNYMHPQAMFVDATSKEEGYFLSGFRDQARSMKSAIVELPERASTRLSWISKLDSAALAAWDKVSLEILVHAPATGAGNLRRLLRSLSQVDLSAVSIPHLTIELPQFMEPELERILYEFSWPPKKGSLQRQPNMLTLRRRIPREKLTEEESSARFLESYWPAQPANSHVLVLSSHTEVAPEFFHYVKYSLLHYRHSNAATMLNWRARSMGISFASPNTLLDTSKPFEVPEPVGSTSVGGFFMWQAPGSDAMLFPGDKWAELHGFVSNLLERQAAATTTPDILARKEVSKSSPSWLEHVLQLCRLRGYVTMYPGAETAKSIVGVHNDLGHIPDEYQGDEEAANGFEANGFGDPATQSFDGSQVDLLAVLPREGALPSMQDLPLLSWDGHPVEAEILDEGSDHFTTQFRLEVGHCSEDEAADRTPKIDASDLFCKL